MKVTDMTDAEIREASRRFYQKWTGKGREDEDDRSYWLDILQRVLGAEDATDRVEFQKKVVIDGNTKRIDAYIPETKVIIEQKSLGVALDKRLHQSGDIDLTPYEQAKRYNDNLPFDEKARWIVVSNFAEIWIYDMNTRVPENNVTRLHIKELQSKYTLLSFLLSEKVKRLSEEKELSLKAGELVGKIHERFQQQYNDPMAKKTQNSLNVLCVRLVFCLYAEDAGLFGAKDAFSRYISQYEPKDIRRALLDLFKVLDTPMDKREELYLDDELASFPYCNGGLFARENIEIPKITQEIKDTLIESSYFDWSKISPTIFGAVFESTLNPETRRSGGMHYTSIENIHKVIDPLFLDELTAELDEINEISIKKIKEQKLKSYQDKLAGLKYLDPSCGSGNFLTETYVCLRRLENQALSELYSGQIVLGDEVFNPIKVGIDQFFGIEINDFAVTVAKTALWIAESQMMKETEDVVHMDLDFLPLKTNANIVEGNALHLAWEHIVPKNELSYIMGNPPFVGYGLQTSEQKNDVLSIYLDENGKPYNAAGKIDYVACWYYKAAKLASNSAVRVAFVSTNSITQGEQVASVWEPLFTLFHIHIDFAYRTFIWDSEANHKAQVHCVIVGFSSASQNKKKTLYIGQSKYIADNINAYLIDAPDIFISSRVKPLCNVPEMTTGNRPADGGHLIIENDELADFISKDPLSKKYIKRLIGSAEFINSKDRWCLWLVNASPNELRQMPEVMKRIDACRIDRENATDAGRRKLANTPALFRETKNPQSYIVVPATSSERRRYIPIGFLDENTIPTNAVIIIPDAYLYHFGVLTSNVHMSWTRAVCGRLKSDYRYSKDIVYNNFPWPELTEEQKTTIEQTAQSILDARALYPDCSLADLYDPLTMPPELRKAHQNNDRAVMKAYGLDIKNTSEEDCVAFLMRKYQEISRKENS